MLILRHLQIECNPWDFPGGPVMKTLLPLQGVSSIQGRGTKIPHASPPSQVKNKIEYNPSQNSNSPFPRNEKAYSNIHMELQRVSK